MARYAKIQVEVVFNEQSFTGFKTQEQAKEFILTAQKMIMKAYRKATNMPDELRPETFQSIPAQLVGTLEGVEDSMLLDEFDGTIRNKGSKSGGTDSEKSEGENNSDSDEKQEEDQKTSVENEENNQGTADVHDVPPVPRKKFIKKKS